MAQDSWVSIDSPSSGDTLGSGNFQVDVSYAVADFAAGKSWEIVMLVYDPVFFNQQGMEINAVTILNFGTRKSLTSSSGTISFNESFQYGAGDPEDLTITAILIKWTDFQGTGIPSEAARDDVNIRFVPTPKPGANAPGAIYISSSPGNAQIWINGQYTVDTNESIDNPFGFTDLAPGQYTVVLRKEGYQDYTETVILNPNEIYNIKAVLTPGVTATGWLQINTNPTDVKVYLQGKQVAIAPILLSDVPPGTYEITLKKDGYDDWYDTVVIAAGQITTINAELPLASGSNFPVGGIVGGAAAVAAAGGGIALLRGRMRGGAVKTAPSPAKDLYQQWWDSATPAQRGNWNSFDDFLNAKLGKPLNGYVNEYGTPSWSSAYNSWKKEAAGTGESFEDWVKRQSTNQDIAENGREWFERNKYARREDIIKADNAVGNAKLNQQRFQRLQELKNIITGDSHLSDWAGDASNAIVKNGIVDPDKLQRFENTLKRWISRDKINQPGPDYSYSDAYYNTLSQASNNIFIRAGMAYLTGGYSEMALNPLSAVSSIQQSIAQGDSVRKAVAKGFAQSALDLGVGEAGRLFKPLAPSATPGSSAVKLTHLDPKTKSELKSLTKLAGQEAQTTRNAFMKSTEVAKVGKNAAYELTAAEKEALRLNNDAGFRKTLLEKSQHIPNNVKELIGTAKQKAYQNARNQAIEDVMNQMAKEGVSTADKTFIIKQTGTHAQPGNPGWNPLKSDFDHTVDFGKPRYNQMYEQRLNAHLKAQGTSTEALDVNVYGNGTSSRGAYTGGAKKFVEHYNETTGSDIMVRNVKGEINITYEKPQTSTSLLGKMNKQDVASASKNYKEFFKKDILKGKSLESQIVNGSKTVSREAGQHGVRSINQFLETGKVNYEPPLAAKVADRIKNFNEPVKIAMEKVGYTGNENQLFNEFKMIMGVK